MGSILNEVLQAKAHANLDEFQDTIGRVEGKVVTLKTELVESLHSCFVLSEADIDRITSWSLEVKNIKDQVVDLVRQFNVEREAFETSTNEIDLTDQSLEKSHKDITILSNLVRIVEDLEAAEVDTNFLQASANLKRAITNLRKVQSEFQNSEDQKWFQQLESAIIGHINILYHEILKDWNSKFVFKKNQLSIDHYGSDVSTMVDTLTNIDHNDRVWSRFTSQLWTEILSKITTPDFQVKIVNPPQSQLGQNHTDLTLSDVTSASVNVSMSATSTKNRYSDEIPCKDSGFSVTSALSSSMTTVTATESFRQPTGSSRTLLVDPIKNSGNVTKTSLSTITGSLQTGRCTILVEKPEVPICKVKQVFNFVVDILRVLATFFQNKPELMSTLGKDVGSRLCSALSTKCLKSLILNNSNGNIDTVRSDIQDLKTFIGNLHELGFILPEDDLQSLQQFLSNFEDLFRKQLREDFCTKTRNFIRADVLKTMKYDPPKLTKRPDQSQRQLIKSPFTLGESMEISVAIYDMVQMFKTHLEAHPDDIFLPLHAFSVFLAIVTIPKHESDQSDLVPLQSAIIHNNCWYLSHHAGFSFKNCEHNVPLLRTKADQAFAFLMRSIRSKLNVMIGAAMSGLEDKIESNKECTKDFLLISAELSRLDEIFKPVLPAYCWKKALGLLVDHTVNEMVTKVLAWDDISANLASELAAAFIKFAVETSHLFKGEATAVREIDALTSKVVKKWQRFRLLTFVLTASMTEIGDKWVQGCGPLAVEFTGEEIRKLVRALFQNTDRRANFLASIK